MSKQVDTSDAAWIEAYRRGDERAFTKLVEHYKRPLFTFIRRMVTNRATAEDLFQETFLRVIRGLPNYREEGKFSSWLFSIANNLCLHYLRKAHLEQSLFLENTNWVELLSDNSPSPDMLLERQEMVALLTKAIEELPLAQKQVFLLRQHTDLTFREIAALLDRPLNTVLAQMGYAMRRLHQQLVEKTS